VRVILHNSKLSLYPLEPRLVSLINFINLILLPLPVTLLVALQLGWVEVFSGVVLPVAQLNDSMNFTKSTSSNYLFVQVDRVCTWSVGLAWFLGRRIAVQAKAFKGRSCVLALLDECL
jgi:hypothetical protein